MLHLEEKLKYVEEEKHRLECRLKNTELELKETQTSLEQSHCKRKVSLCTLFVYNQCFSRIKSYQRRGLHVACPFKGQNLLKPRPDWSPLGVTKSLSQAQMVSFRG